MLAFRTDGVVVFRRGRILFCRILCIRGRGDEVG